MLSFNNKVFFIENKNISFQYHINFIYKFYYSKYKSNRKTTINSFKLLSHFNKVYENLLNIFYFNEVSNKNT